MSRASLLLAGRLVSLASDACVLRAAPSLVALQGALGSSSASFVRQFGSSAPATAAREQQQHQTQQDQQQQQRQRGKGSSGGSRVQRSGGRQHQAGAGHQRRLYIPQQWEQQGWEDRNLPLVEEMLAHIKAEDAWAARRTFEAAVAPLEEMVSKGEAVPAEQVPPPYAWKLYMAALSATACHAHRMSDCVTLMEKLGVAPQAACYVIALRQMAVQGIGHPAFTTIAHMKGLGVTPTLRCYMFAIEANLRSQSPEHNFAKKLFEEVAELKLAMYPAQKAVMGKLLMFGAREFAQHRRFNHALALLYQLEGLGLRVPAFLIADVLQMAVQAFNAEAMAGCVKRLAAATSTFQEVPGEGEPITRPLKVEEGLLLTVLEAAANQGNVELAEATWELLVRSVALPNPPSTGGALQTHMGKAAEIQRLDTAQHAQQAQHAQHAQQQQEQQEGDVAEGDEEAGEGDEQAPGPEVEGALEQLSAELEAADLAAAELALTGSQQGKGKHGPKGGHGGDAGAASLAHPASVPQWGELAREEARGMAGQPRGMRTPQLVSYLARVHAYAKAGGAEGMFQAVDDLQAAFPDDESVASYHHGLPMCVDALAQSVQAADKAFDLLEGWTKEGRTVSTAQLNLVVAAYCQMGDLKRAFATFDAFENMGVTPNADTYNALMQGCVELGRVDTCLKVFEQMQEGEVQANSCTHHQLVDACVVMGNVPSMMSALAAMDAAGHTPKLALLERCLARAERAGDREGVHTLLARLFQNDYRIVGVDAKCRRWAPEGGMRMLTGSSTWFSREEVLRELRKDETISSRIARRGALEGKQQPDEQPEQQAEGQQ